MHLKRYRRHTVKEALRAVREELGPDALVLSTRVVTTGGLFGWLGRREVEITAAAPRPEMSGDRHRESARRRARGVTALAARLEASGMDAAVARELAAAAPLTARRDPGAVALRQTLAEQLAPLTSPGHEGYAAVEVFVGPPGVGKTTTVAKIAAQERARTGRRLGLVSADGFRVGAVEQLRLFAGIIGAPFTAVRSAGQLVQALGGRRRPLLIDTAGRSPSDDAAREMFDVFAGRRDVRVNLVIAASTPPGIVRRDIERFEHAQPARLVITKVDEVESIAPLVGVLRACRLPVAYFGTGQNVPEDLQPATPEALAGWVLGEGAAA